MKKDGTLYNYTGLGVNPSTISVGNDVFCVRISQATKAMSGLGCGFNARVMCELDCRPGLQHSTFNMAAS